MESFLKMININTDNQIILTRLYGEVEKDNYAEGVTGERWCTIAEEKVFHSEEKLKGWLNNFGLELKDFRRFDRDDEPNRLSYNRNEDGEGREITLTKDKPDGFFASYDLIIEVYDMETETDYLKDFEELD